MTPEEAREALAERKTREQALSYGNGNESLPEFDEGKKLDINNAYRPWKTILPNAIYHAGNQTLNAPMSLVHGLLQPLLEQEEPGFISDMSKDIGAKRKAEFEEGLQESPVATVGGGILGTAALLNPFARVIGATANMSLIPRLASNSTIGGLISGADYVDPGESRLWNAGKGAIAGGLIPETIIGTGKAIGKVYNAAKKNIPEIAKRVMETGKQHNVPVYAADVAPKGGQLQGTTELLEKTPIVTVKTERIAQQDAAKKAAQKVLETAEEKMINTEFLGPKGIEKLEQVANNVGPRQAKAKKILDQIKNSGDEWNHIIQAGGNAQLLASQVHSDYLYNNVNKLASKLGNVDYSDSVNAFVKSVNGLKKLPNTNEKSIKDLLKISRDFVGADGKIKPRTFEELREVRSTLAAKINEYYSGKNSLIGEKGVEQLQIFKNALDKDLEKFAKSKSPALKAAWEDADKFYKTNVVSYKDKQLAKALKDETNPDEIYSMFIKTGGSEGDKGTGRAEKFFNALDPKGQQAVRYGIIKQAWEKAVDSTGNFSPAKFATQMEKLAASRGVFFKGQDKRTIDGFTELMRHIERAGQMKAPDTGVKSVPVLLAAMLGTAGVSKAAGGLGATSLLKSLMLTQKGRYLLLAADKLDPNSPKWASLMANIYSYVKKRSDVIGAGAATNIAKATNAKDDTEADQKDEQEAQ